MYRYEDIRRLHVEPTERCNAACPMCSRNHHGSRVNPSLRNHEISVADFRAMLPDAFLRQLDEINFCGNFGDPIVAQDLVEILRHARDVNPRLRLRMHTNGGARSPDYWEDLGVLFQRDGDAVAFGIDGLADTHHLYRRQTDWNVVLENASRFLQAGGRAHWDLLVFRHNEHQIEACRTMAKEMGFLRFNIKATKRFLQTTTSRLDSEFPVLDEDGTVLYTLEPTTDSSYANRSLTELQDLEDAYGSLDAYLDRTPIRCRVLDPAGLYLSAAGYVVPCCWVASQLCPPHGEPQRTEIYRLIERAGGIDRVDARKRSLREIVEGEFFQTVLPESWAQPSLKAGRPRVCARICGCELKSFENQFHVQDLTRPSQEPPAKGT